MNAVQFNNLLEKPSPISVSETAALGELVDQFPYFQSAHLLYLKGLHQNNNLEYAKELKVTAAYANDRKKLYELIMQEDLHKKIQLVEEYAEEKPSEKTNISPLEAQILQEAVSASIKLEVGQLAEENKEKGKESIPKAALEKQATEIEESGHFDFSKKRTFNEWLRASQNHPNTTEETLDKSTDKDQLIDSFIGSAPRIGDASKNESGRQPFFSPIDTARLSIIDDPSFVTETLAGIYEAQGHLEKAKNAYTLLSLKNPEKRNTFAARISDLENRLKNKE